MPEPTRGRGDDVFQHACRCQEGSTDGGCRRLREGDETRGSAATLLEAAGAALEKAASARPGWSGTGLPLAGGDTHGGEGGNFGGGLGARL